MNHKAVLVTLGLAGTALILLATAPYGSGLSNDSVGYISFARQIAAGLGAITETGTPLTVWPPLYPALLAAISIIAGLDPIECARFLNALLFGLIIYLSGILFLKHLKQSATCALLGTAFLLISAPLIEHMLWTLSETLFICFVLLYLIFIESYLAKANITSLLLLSLSVSLACLTRYIGIILIFTGAISLLFLSRDRLALKLRSLAIFVTISALPIGIWVVRNYFLSGTFFGSRGESIFTLPQNLYFLAKAVQYWYFPEKISDYPAMLVLIGGTTIVLLSTLIKNKNWVDIKAFVIEIHTLILFVAIYVVFLLYASTTVAYDQINNRLLCPIYIPLAILTLLFIFHSHQLLIKLTQKWISKKSVDVLLIATILIWLLYPMLCATAIIKHTIKHGEGYSSKKWQNHKTIGYLRTHPLPVECSRYDSSYTNAPKALYILTNTTAQPSPAMTVYNSPEIANSLSSISKGWPKDSSACLIWFKGSRQKNLFSLYELNTIADLQVIANFDDGTIYRVQKKTTVKE